VEAEEERKPDWRKSGSPVEAHLAAVGGGSYVGSPAEAGGSPAEARRKHRRWRKLGHCSGQKSGTRRSPYSPH